MVFFLDTPGVLVWHDFNNDPVPGATKAIAEWSAKYDVRWVRGTWLAYAEFA